MLRIGVRGLDEAQAAINRMAGISGGLDRLRRLFGSVVHANIKSLTPVDTGFLRNSNYFDFVGSSVVFANYADEYDVYVEFGTGQRGAASYEEYIKGFEQKPTYSPEWAGMVGQPHIRPGVAQGLNDLDGMVDHLMDETL